MRTSLVNLTAFAALAMFGATPIGAQSAASAEEQIEGYYRVCKATLEMKFGTINAQRQLTDDGTQLQSSDIANWGPKNYGNPQPGISISWHSFGSFQGNFRTIKDADSSIQLFFRTDKKLPRQSLWRFKRPATSSIVSSDSALSAFIFTGADKRLAGTKFSFAEFLAFAVGFDKLTWEMRGFPDSKDFSKTYFAGYTDMAAFREAQAAVPKLEELLAAKAAKFETECRREAIYYSDDAEIITTAASAR